MGLDARELVAALPADLETGESLSPQETLQHLLGKLSTKPVPVSALTRLWTLGTLQAKIAVAYLAYWIRSGYATADEKERRLNETHLKAAIELLGGMGYLRGAIAKIGQMLAGYPGIVPAEFVDALGKLHFEAPPMHYSLLREHVRHELGGDPEELFADFEPRAFAAASLGQVHRAHLKSGEAVAVKIQYPNIAGTIRSDVRSLLALMTPMRLSKDWDNIRAQWDDIRQMLEWETDYRREAGFLRRAREVFCPEDRIVVPEVFEAFSTERVLTMEYVDGLHIDAYLGTKPSREECDRYGTLLMRTSFRLLHKANLWYADSNPGNYLFLPDGRLGLLDFGCCRDFSDAEWDYYWHTNRAHRQGGEAFLKAMMRAVDLDPNQPIEEEYAAFLVRLGRWFSDCLVHDGPFDFGNEAFIQQGIDLMGEAARKRYFRTKPVNLWLDRHIFGLRALGYRLRARVNVKRLVEQEAPQLLE